MSGNLAAAWSKLEGYAARFALLVHLIRAESDDPSLVNPMAVDAQSIAAGVALSRWFGDETVRVYTAIGDDGETDEQREQRNVARLVREFGGRITANDLRRRSRSFATSEEAEAALQRLVDARKGCWESPPTGPAGGRPTRYFMLFESVSVSETTISPDENEGLGNGDNANRLLLPAAGTEEEVTEWAA